MKSWWKSFDFSPHGRPSLSLFTCLTLLRVFLLFKGLSVVSLCSAWLLLSISLHGYFRKVAFMPKQQGKHQCERPLIPIQKNAMKFQLGSWRSHWSVVSSSFFLLQREFFLKTLTGLLKPFSLKLYHCMLSIMSMVKWFLMNSLYQ